MTTPTTYRIGAIYELGLEGHGLLPYRPDARALMAPECPAEDECVWGTWFLADGTIAPGYIRTNVLTDDRLMSHDCGCVEVHTYIRADGPAPRYGRQSAHFECSAHPRG